MNRIQAAKLSFKVLKLCNKFLKDYKLIKKEYKDVDFKNYDNLVKEYLISNLEKGEKK